MNKSFEESYRELAQNEAPDLWNRIEAGLTDKSASKSTSGSVSESTQKSADSTDSEQSENLRAETKQSRNLLFYFRRYMAVAAAILCVILVIPALSLMKQSAGGTKGMSADMMNETAMAADEVITEETAMEEAAMEEAAAEESVMPEEALEETAEQQEKFLAKGTFSAEGAMEEEALEEASVPAKEAALENGEDSAAAVADSAAKSLVTEMESQKSANSRMALTDGTVLSEVTVIATAQSEIFEHETEGMGVLFTAEVQEDLSKVLQAGEEINIFLPATSSLGILGEACTLDLVYRAEGDYFCVGFK